MEVLGTVFLALLIVAALIAVVVVALSAARHLAVSAPAPHVRPYSHH